MIAYRGYDSQGKKLSPKTRTIKVTEKMSEKRLAKLLDAEAEKFQQEVDIGIYLDASKLMFEEFAQRWINDYAEKQLQTKTIARYKDFLARINKAIGHIRLERLQPHHLNDFYANLAENGVRRDGKYTLRPSYYKEVAEDKRALAVMAIINTRTLTGLLNGNKTTLEVAEKIATVLNITVNKAFQAEEQAVGLNPKTILEHHRLIHAILSRAVKWQVVTNNIADRAEPPKVTRTEAEYYDEHKFYDYWTPLRMSL